MKFFYLNYCEHAVCVESDIQSVRIGRIQDHKILMFDKSIFIDTETGGAKKIKLVNCHDIWMKYDENTLFLIDRKVYDIEKAFKKILETMHKGHFFPYFDKLKNAYLNMEQYNKNNLSRIQRMKEEKGLVTA
jgi:hypothetical protein